MRIYDKFEALRKLTGTATRIKDHWDDLLCETNFVTTPLTICAELRKALGKFTVTHGRQDQVMQNLCCTYMTTR